MQSFPLLGTHSCTHSHPQEEQPGGHYCQRLTPPVCQALGQVGECLWNTAPPDLAASEPHPWFPALPLPLTAFFLVLQAEIQVENFTEIVHLLYTHWADYTGDRYVVHQASSSKGAQGLHHAEVGSSQITPVLAYWSLWWSRRWPGNQAA